MRPDRSSTRPDFFLVGAAKCGTTSLANHLGGHPEVFVSNPKEPNFFAFPPGAKPSCVGPAPEALLYEKLLKYSVTSPSAYQGLFAGAGDAAAVGEASVRYLYEPTAAERIAEYNPGARVVALLRDPVERMHSHYHMNVKNGLEPLSFRQALDAEDERVAAGWGWDWHYRRVSQYGEQLQRYLDRFGADRVLVLYQRDLRDEPLVVWDRLCRFLGVSPRHEPSFQRKSLVGRTPRSRLVQRLVWMDNPLKRAAKRLLPTALRKGIGARINAANTGGVPPLSQQERGRLGDWFREDRDRLAALTGGPPPW